MKFLLIALLALAACKPPAPTAPTASIPGNLTPTDAAASTFKIQLSDGSSGTGWLVRDGHTLMTADHVCASSDDEPTYSAIDRWGNETAVTILARHPTYDLCAMRSEVSLGHPMPISTAALEYDALVMFVGAPNGEYGCGGWEPEACGMAPISRGHYAGGNLVSIPSTGGASGAALFTADGVIGVLVAGYRGFDSLTYMEPRSRLREFLDTI